MNIIYIDVMILFCQKSLHKYTVYNIHVDLSLQKHYKLNSQAINII